MVAGLGSGAGGRIASQAGVKTSGAWVPTNMGVLEKTYQISVYPKAGLYHNQLVV